MAASVSFLFWGHREAFNIQIWLSEQENVYFPSPRRGPLVGRMIYEASLLIVDVIYDYTYGCDLVFKYIIYLYVHLS